MLCARCGHQNPEDARFCSSCGAPLGAADEETTLTLSAIEASTAEDELEHYLDGLPPGVGMLVVRHGPNAGSSYRLETAVTAIGQGLRLGCRGAEAGRPQPRHGHCQGRAFASAASHSCCPPVPFC